MTIDRFNSPHNPRDRTLLPSQRSTPYRYPCDVFGAVESVSHIVHFVPESLTCNPSTLLRERASPPLGSRCPRLPPPISVARLRARPYNLKEQSKGPRSTISAILQARDGRVDRPRLTRTSTRDRLSVLLVLHVTSGEDPLDAGLRSPRNGDDVTIGVGMNLFPDERSGGLMTDGVEETIDVQLRRLARLDVLDSERLKKVAVTLAFGRHGLFESE